MKAVGLRGDLSQIKDQHTRDYLNRKEACKSEKNFQGQFGVFFPSLEYNEHSSLPFQDALWPLPRGWIEIGQQTTT